MSTTTTLFGSTEAQAARDLIGGTAIGDLRNELLRQILVATANRTGGTAWGSITGTLSAQTDLQAALNAKLSLAGGTMTGDLAIAVVSPTTVSAGYLGVPQNSQSAAYTTVLTDAGKHIYHPSADTTARTWTIAANASVAYPIGTAITFVNDTSAGVITIAINSDTLVLAGAGTTGSRTLAANGIATAVKITSTRWMISGTGLS